MTNQQTKSNRRGRPAKVNANYPSGLSIDEQLAWLIEHNPSKNADELSKFVSSDTMEHDVITQAATEVAKPKRQSSPMYKMAILPVTNGLEACRIWRGKDYERILIRENGGDWHDPANMPELVIKALSRSLRSKKYGAKVVATFHSLDAMSFFVKPENNGLVHSGG